MTQNPIDRAHNLLSRLGWSHGDMSYRQDGRQVWQGYAHRDEDQVVVNALTQTAAWDEALWQAGIVQRSC